MLAKKKITFFLIIDYRFFVEEIFDCTGKGVY
jgi:hypothetical protein